MIKHWLPVIRSLLDMKNETGLIFMSPDSVEVWKGTDSECPWFEAYKTRNVIISHTHPTKNLFNPPSPLDFVNTLGGVHPHLVFSHEGVWIYSPNDAFKKEWVELDQTKKEKLREIVLNNTYGAVASFMGGKFLESFAEGVPRIKIDYDEFIKKLNHVIPRKDPTLPALGFCVRLYGWDDDWEIGIPQEQDRDHCWSLEEARQSLKQTTEGAQEGVCVTCDGSIVV
jgi:hypothetical protein